VQAIPDGYHNGSGSVKAAFVLEAGDTLIKQVSPANTSSLVPIVVGTITVKAGGIIRTDIYLHSGSDGTLANAQLYVNGIARGILRQMSSAGAVHYIEDITVDVGDVLGFYAWMGAGGTYSYIVGATIKALTVALAV
jgi:hypothetical protein